MKGRRATKTLRQIEAEIDEALTRPEMRIGEPVLAIVTRRVASSKKDRRTVTGVCRATIADMNGKLVKIVVTAGNVADGAAPGRTIEALRCDLYSDTTEGRRAFKERIQMYWGPGAHRT